MSRRSTLKVTVCRGGRCGGRKHPGFDHDSQLADLEAAAARVDGICQTTDCLALCSASNVVVVARNRERTFLGRTAQVDRAMAIRDWIAAGATTPLPAAVAAAVIDPKLEFEEGD